MRVFEALRTANHNLFRNKVRTGLTILAVFVGSFTIILNVAINTGVNAFIDDQTASLGGEDYIMIMSDGSSDYVMSEMSGPSSDGPTEYDPNRKVTAMTEDQLDKLAAIDGLERDDFYVSYNIPVEYITSADTDKKYNITIGTMPPGNFNIALTAGSMPNEDSDKHQIVLEPGYAKALGFNSDENAIGKTITLMILDPYTAKEHTFTATVVGVQASGVVAVNASIINRSFEKTIVDKIIPNGQEDSTYMIQTRFDISKYTEEEIKQVLKENGFTGITVSDLMGTIRTFFDVIMIVFSIFGGIALLAAAIGIVNTLLMSVEERTREIGLDKALGMSSGRVFWEFATEAILLGFWGSTIGIVLAMLVGTGINAAVHAPGGFLEVFPTFHLFIFTISNMLPIVIIIMTIALIAGTAPAWKAAHKNPIDALRYE